MSERWCDLVAVPDRPRVLLLVTRLVGGAARTTLLLGRELTQLGFEVAFVTGPEKEGDISIPADLPHMVIPSLQRSIGPLADVSALRSILALMRRYQPDVVSAHMSKVGVLGRIAGGLLRVPAIVRWYHGHVLRGYFSPSTSKRYTNIERILARQTDALVAVSTVVRDELAHLGIGAPSRWHVIPLGVDLDSISNHVISKRAARRQMGLPTRGPVVGIVGRLTPVKDHETFLAAAAAIKDRHPDATFLVAGEGELRPSLEATGQRTLGRSVSFLGWVSDLAMYYSALDVLLLTSRQEGTPRALIEAAAAGRPVVATDVGGVREVVQDAITGYLALPGDPKSVAEGTLHLLDSPSAMKSMGEAAKQSARQRFSSERFAKDVANLFDMLLQRRMSWRKGATLGS